MSHSAVKSAKDGPFFSIYWDPHAGKMVEEKRHVPLLEVMDAFRRLTSAHCAFVVKRVFVVSDDEDYVTLDWDCVWGFTFPTAQTHPALYAQLSQMYPATNGGLEGLQPQPPRYKKEDRNRRDEGRS
jgi:hypothetical protein